MSVTITTAGIDPASKSTHWHQSIAETYFPLDLKFREPGRFDGEISSWALGNVSLSRLRSQPLMYCRSPKHLVDESREQLLVTIPAKAEVSFSQCGRDVRCGKGSFVLERSYEPYEFSHEQASDLWVLKVDAAALGNRIRDPDRFCGMRFDATSGAGGLFADMVGHIPIRYEAISGGAREHVGQQLVDLLALSLKEDDRTLSAGNSSVRSAHLLRAEAFVHANLSERDLAPETIADGCGISVRYLHEVFRDTNQTLGQWIRELRLNAAREDLAAPENGRSIAEICYRRGFGDQAQFSRLFKKRFGCTPREWKHSQVR
ncbi:MAG: helix-turn-helix domain-containing protein [Stappiaceae bacterium]